MKPERKLRFFDGQFCRKILRNRPLDLTKIKERSDYTVFLATGPGARRKGENRMTVMEKRPGKYLAREERAKENIGISEMYRQKLIGYAESFQELARSLKEPVLEITTETDRMKILEERKIQESRLLISGNLSEVAQIMKELAEELYHYRPMEERVRRMLVHALRAESVYADDFCYLKGVVENGEENSHGISVTLYTDKKKGIPALEVADMLSVLLRRHLQLSAASPYLVGPEAHRFVFMEEAKYIAITGFCKVTKEGEALSGDHYSILESEKGKMTILLSDGTGSGEQASADSERVLDLMEKLLEAGYSLESAVSMVNAASFVKGQEYSHPTLDVCDLDLYSGSCSFCKVGGAASFLKHGSRVEQIREGNLPLGVFSTVETHTVRRQLQDGDYLIMMTDGVLDALSDGCYEEMMQQAIAELEEVNPGEFAEKLLQMALRCCGGHIRDDMTILVAGVWRNSSNTI